MPDQQSPGLMQALAPIVSRRPVHLIISASAINPELLHVVCQPTRLSDEEDGEICTGFTADATPEELDRDLPGIISTTWVPAHQSLQTVLDQVAERARQASADKAKGGIKTGGKKPAGAGAQTTMIGTTGDGTPPLLALPPAAADAAVESEGGEGASSSAESEPVPEALAARPAAETPAPAAPMEQTHAAAQSANAESPGVGRARTAVEGHSGASVLPFPASAIPIPAYATVPHHDDGISSLFN